MNSLLFPGLQFHYMLRLLVSTSLRDVYFWLLSAKITRLVDCGCIRLAWIASVNLSLFVTHGWRFLTCCVVVVCLKTLLCQMLLVTLIDKLDDCYDACARYGH